MTKERLTKPSNKIRVLLVDDHAAVRTGVRRLLEKARDMLVVGEAGDGFQAIKMVEELEPDIVVLDVEMPRMNGLAVARQLTDQHAAVKILALSAYDDRQYILGMLDQGAAGYMIKDEVPEMLVQAIRDITVVNQPWLSKRVERMIQSG
jgi:DNA-binding NarL/FixJ family response regulator